MYSLVPSPKEEEEGLGIRLLDDWKSVTFSLLGERPLWGICSPQVSMHVTACDRVYKAFFCVSTASEG